MIPPVSPGLFRRIWALTWPMVLYNALEMTVGLVDLLMVRSFGQTATAAIGVCRQVTFLVEGSVVLITSGALALVSQAVGSRSQSQVDEVVRASIFLVSLLGIPVTLAGSLLSRPLLIALNASEQTMVHGEPYLRVYFLGLLFLWGNLVITALFRGSGDPWTPLMLALGVNLLNIVLNYVFIFGIGPVPAFHVQGAALATVAARACGMLVFGVILLRGSRPIRLRLVGASTPEGRGQLLGRMLRIGLPMALAALLRNGSRVVFLAIVGASSLGVSFHAAVGVGFQVRLFSILPALAFQAATATLVGQAIGRGDYQEAEALGQRSVQLLTALMVVVVGTILVLARPLAGLLMGAPEAIDLGTTVLRWFAVAQFFSALSIATQGVLMGAGDTGPAMRYTLVSQWIVMLPLAWVLFWIVGWIPGGPLAAWTLAPVLSFVLLQRRFRSGRWKTILSSAPGGAESRPRDNSPGRNPSAPGGAESRPRDNSPGRNPG
jgi:putative MATE family efflux protein